MRKKRRRGKKGGGEEDTGISQDANAKFSGRTGPMMRKAKMNVHSPPSCARLPPQAARGARVLVQREKDTKGTVSKYLKKRKLRKERKLMSYCPHDNTRARERKRQIFIKYNDFPRRVQLVLTHQI